MQLVELLEVPQLVDACARNGFYDEALELANFVNGLERRHLLASEVNATGNIAPKQSSKTNTANRAGSNVVQSIVDDVYKTLLSLRSQLLQLLTEDSSLPQELHILGTLRKLDTLMIDRQLSLERYNNEKFMQLSEPQRDEIRRHMLKGSESRLQMSFLEARSLWLRKQFERSSTMSSITNPSAVGGEIKSTVTGSDNLGPYGKAIEMLEVSRTAWFSIITQYNALFADHKDGPSAGAHPTDAILYAWVTRQVDKLLHHLKLLLPQIEEGGSIRSIFEQTIFFATRMREVGGDFTSLALPIFTDVICQRVIHDWKFALEQFQRILETEKIVLDNDDFAREQVCSFESYPRF
jgi:conserved oligomeric Golgi complex subunit 8